MFVTIAMRSWKIMQFKNTCVWEHEHTEWRGPLVGLLIFSLVPEPLLLSELSPSMSLRAACVFDWAAHLENRMTFEECLEIRDAWFRTVHFITKLPLHLGQGHGTFCSGIVLSWTRQSDLQQCWKLEINSDLNCANTAVFSSTQIWAVTAVQCRGGFHWV